MITLFKLYYHNSKFNTVIVNKTTISFYMKFEIGEVLDK